MNSWINLHALWKIVVVGLLAGVGLPAVFALGLKALSLGPRSTTVATVATTATAATGAAAAASTPADNERMSGGSPVGLAVGGLCFAVVLAGIAWGIYFIVAGS